jgi:DNA-directed RNA polymerase specialized sigma24 family protein
MKFLSNSGASGKDRSESSTDEDNAALAVAKGVAQLPILEREALILREYERLELDEIAAIVGADTKTVTDRLANARQRLRKSLANHLLA